MADPSAWLRTPGHGAYSRPEVERRFTLRADPPGTSGARLVEDRYLTGTTLRLRRVTGDGAMVHKLTQKVRTDDGDPSRVLLTNTYLTAAEHALLADLPGHDLVKTRSAVAGTPTFVVDVFHRHLAGLRLAEVEVDDLAAPLVLPPWLGSEVTHDDRFSGGALAAADGPLRSRVLSLGAAGARAARDVELDAVLLGGRERPSIVISASDPAWPGRFAEVQRGVLRALSDVALSVDHIGSTSVPGLGAKPVVDVLLTVRSVEAEAAYVEPLERAGFVLRVREPSHRMFRTPERDVHLHVYASGDQAVTDYLDLRDWLRVSAPDRALYEATKRALAERAWTDMNHYADAKTDVVRTVLARARAWRAAAAPDGHGGST